MYATSSDSRIVHSVVAHNLPPKMLVNIEDEVICPFHYFPDYLPLLLQLSKYVSSEFKCVSMRQYSSSIYIDAPHIDNPLSILINNYRASIGLSPIEVSSINTDPLNLLCLYIHKHGLSRRSAVNKCISNLKVFGEVCGVQLKLKTNPTF